MDLRGFEFSLTPDGPLLCLTVRSGMLGHTVTLTPAEVQSLASYLLTAVDRMSTQHEP